VSARTVKVHLLTGELRWNGSAKMFCGKIGWECDDISSEYNDEIGNRFEATAKRKECTCKSCQRAADAA
jgi:hypothetical protein